MHVRLGVPHMAACQEPGEYGRGCWAGDALLGKR
jgi:hypothetical protein